jgi:hypothetical protein
MLLSGLVAMVRPAQEVDNKMKIGKLPILSAGFAVGIVALSWGYFKRYVPNMELYEGTKAAAESFETEARKLPQANKKYRKAVEDVRKDEATWQEVVAMRTPTNSLASGGIDLGVNAFQLTVDARNFRNSVQTWVNRQVRKGGVQVDFGGNPIPMPDSSASTIVANYFNYPAMPFPVVIFDLGQIRVRGTWEQIKQNVEGWSSMPNYLAVADGLTLEGTGDILNATYNVTIVGFLRGDKIYPVVPEVAGGGSNPGGGGGSRGGGGAPQRQAAQGI